MSSRDYYQRVMPIGLLYAGSLWLSNSSYLYLSVSFIQMTKSLMPGLVYASGVFIGTEKFTRGTTLNMILIAFGVVVCAVGETDLSVKGLIQQLCALVFEAFRLTLVQVLINSKGLSMNPIQSLYYISPSCLVCLLVPFICVDLQSMRKVSEWELNISVLVANAVTALILNLAVFLLIGKTSALTMNIAGVIKDWMLIYFSYSIFKAPISRTSLVGYVFCCSGVVIYNHMKLQAIKARVAVQSNSERLDGSTKRVDGVCNVGAESDSDGGVKSSTYVGSDRSKDDILLEIRRLQAQMTQLESRVEWSQKMYEEAGQIPETVKGPTGMQGNGSGAIHGSKDVIPAAAAKSLSPTATPVAAVLATIADELIESNVNQANKDK
eukprot:CAMPEP_0175054176 /NCGR_PEP_ID=MMETSP0052_2-20121109/9356_1 /TAXON_ID=51329 ORGANISM="Polytomella parva, Strain SAG 63-3" /NCGR_SAMPLE_ID=MMETSP0052_2 /ASSEMBLY_ACC=CAM_ASM_000194 /LENGTH=379 /DNA_ID=CAMNT_0016318835 /DNA_START=207 /DNA_END=1346 /DNA_ORIENTATION=+